SDADVRTNHFEPSRHRECLESGSQGQSGNRSLTGPWFQGDAIMQEGDAVMNTCDDRDARGDGRVLAFICGALVGASAALLLAPMKGTDLRASIGDASNRGRDRLRQASRDGRDKANHYAQHAGDWAQETAHQ